MSEIPGIFVVIPSYNEESLLPVVNSLKKAHTTQDLVGIILLINAPSTASSLVKERNTTCYKEVVEWAKGNSNALFQVQCFLENDLDPGKAGVGLARKLGMDKASEIYLKGGVEGVIVALDADCEVESSYFSAITSYFSDHEKVQAANIYFEHRFISDDPALNEAALQYELHLRYFKQCLFLINFPFAYHTVGSSMSVRSEAYRKSGGMNTRQAGEDFYFLQRLFSQYEFGEINSTTVYPEGRFSDRVPFGTGAALLKWQENGRNDIPTYAFKSFLEVGKFFDLIIKEYQTDDVLSDSRINKRIREFLSLERFEKTLLNIKKNCRNESQFKAHFFRWFNNFKILKCLNYLRDTELPMLSVKDESAKLLEALGLKSPESSLDMLVIFRNLDKT